MEFKPVARRSISDEITESILKMILHEDIKPGERLPSERDLAIRFETNRNTLREAIRNLQTLNVVAARQGDGLRVLDFRREGEINLLPFFLKHASGLDERIVVTDDMLQFRRQLLTEVTGKIAQNGSSEKFDQMELLIEKQRHQKDDPEALVRTDLELLYFFVDAGDSLAFRWLFNTFAKVYGEAAFQFPSLIVFTPEYPEPLQDIVDAARKGDAKEAMALMLAHLEDSDDLILGAIKNLRDMLD